jgi:hypothetical protein
LTTTNNDKVGNRLTEESGKTKEFTTGISRDGMSDPTGEYPRLSNWFNSSVSSPGRGVEVNNVWMGGSVLGASFDVPYASPSIFPFNQTNNTPSGHSFEIDDTPGNERILIKHHTGAGVELKQDGSVVVASRSHQVQVVGADHELVVSGQGNMTYDGDLNLTVNGNYNVDVGGTYNVKVGANQNTSVHGSSTTEVGDVHSTIVRGNKDVKVWGDTFDFYCGDVKVAAKKDVRTLVQKDYIVNAGRHFRATAEDTVATTAGVSSIFSAPDMNITAPSGKIGGVNMHYVGSLYTGPDDDNGAKTVFQGNLVGRALEAWTSKFSKYSEEAFHAHISNYATKADYADDAGYAAWATMAAQSDKAVSLDGAYAKPTETTEYNAWSTGDTQDARSELSPSSPDGPDYQFDWGWEVSSTAGNRIRQRLGYTNSPNYSTSSSWHEVYNKVSPFAVRKVLIDQDDAIENKIAKHDTYSYYFNWTPSTQEIRSKLRTMDGANDTQTSPEGQTDGAKCIQSLLDENRLGPRYSLSLPDTPYSVKRTGQSIPTARFGYTLLGNPLERSSKTFLPKNRGITTRTILADPVYNPDKHNAPITSNTKLSKSATVSKFFGSPGSKSSIEYVPLFEQRQNLARQWYLHAWLMEGVASAKEFSRYRLQVTEGYYNPANGIRETYEVGSSGGKFWREPYRTEDGGSTQRSLVVGRPTINQLKYEGRAVVYTLFNSRGKVDYAATFDLSLYMRDTFFYDQISLDYDMVRPDGQMSQQLIVVMPTVTTSFEVSFQMKVGTYFNRRLYSQEDLVEITD